MKACMAQTARSSSPARSPARSTRRPCRPICRSRRTRSPMKRSAPRKPARRSCISMPAIPRTASPTRRRKPSRRSCRASSRQPNAAINITTGGSPYMKVEERVLPGRDLQARGRLAQHGLDQFRPLSSCSTSTRPSSSTGRSRISRRRAICVFRNTFKDIEFILEDLLRQRHALRVRVLRHRPSLQPRPLRRPRPGQAAVLRPVGVRHPRRHRPPSGRRGTHEAHGRPPVRRQVIAGRCSAPAPASCRIAAQAAALGGNVRVGLEDSLWAGRGKLAKSNAEQVTLARKIIEGLGMEVATPDDARAILELKGGDKVAF